MRPSSGMVVTGKHPTPENSLCAPGATYRHDKWTRNPAPGKFFWRWNMPRKRHWFHVSHDINSDEEVWELTDEYGAWGLRVWFQLLSIADRNEGVVKGDLDTLSRGMSRLWGSNSKRYNSEWRTNRARIMLEWMSNKRWIRIESDAVTIVNWLIYNPKRSQPVPVDPAPTNQSYPNQPKYPKKDTYKSAHKCAYPTDFAITEEIRKWALKNCLPDPDLQLEAFRDFHISKGSRFASWPAAFRTWMRNAVRFNNGRPRLSRIDAKRQQTQDVLKRGLE
jgi:hypothetical protein